MTNEKNENSLKIKSLWKESGLSITEMAKVVGISSYTVKSWCLQKRNPPYYVVDLVEKRMLEYMNGRKEDSNAEKEKVH